jgi:uncharacterized phiE125 gp8 family phage protein
MTMILTSMARTTDPTALAVSLSDAGEHLRIEEDADQVQLLRYVKSATGLVEGFIGRSLISQTWTVTYDGVPKQRIALPRAPLVSVTSVKYAKLDDIIATFPSNQYVLDKPTARIFLASGCSWPSDVRCTASYEVIYVAGYGATDTTVPIQIRHAILRVAGWLYETREAGAAEGQQVFDDATLRQELAPFNRNLVP